MLCVTEQAWAGASSSRDKCQSSPVSCGSQHSCSTEQEHHLDGLGQYSLCLPQLWSCARPALMGQEGRWCQQLHMPHVSQGIETFIAQLISSFVCLSSYSYHLLLMALGIAVISLLWRLKGQFVFCWLSNIFAVWPQKMCSYIWRHCLMCCQQKCMHILFCYVPIYSI